MDRKGLLDAIGAGVRYISQSRETLALGLLLARWELTFNTVPHVVVTPNHNVIFIVISCHYVATVMNRNAHTCVFQWS